MFVRGWIVAVLGLAGCVARAPAGPAVMALPAPGETFAVFQQHDTTCRAYASARTGGASPGQAAAKSEVATAATATGLSAAAGALFGSVSGHAGTGAAIGAGAGLLTGGLLGVGSGARAASSLQHQYDIAYTQCMVADGERIVPPAAPPPVFYAPPPQVVYVPAPVYALPPPPPPPQP